MKIQLLIRTTFLVMVLAFAITINAVEPNEPDITSFVKPSALPLQPTVMPDAGLVSHRKLTTSYSNFRLSTVERGIYGDGWADVILGQPDFSQITPNEVVGDKLFNPGGVYVDRSVRPNRVYVYDAGNSRVLGFSYLGTCLAGTGVGQNCTCTSDCPESSCQIQENRTADVILGQSSSHSSTCNGDSAFQSYPDRSAARADTLCGIPPWALSITEAGAFATMTTDEHGNFYITDLYNNRVLRYDSPFDNDNIADYVWGQVDFSGVMCNRGASYNHPDSSSLCLAPQPGWGDIISGVSIDTDNNLWVADTQNNRILRFPFDSPSGVPAQEANLVLGQPNFSVAAPGEELGQMHNPTSIRVDNQGLVYVADGFLGGSGSTRVLVFEPPFSNGMPANHTIGSNLLESNGLEIDPNSGVWVNDKEKILHFVDGNLQNTITPVPNRVTGGIGIDCDGNVMATGWDPQQILIYAPPTYTWESTFVKADNYGSFNQTGDRGVYGGVGLEIAAGQLMYSDGPRILFWNDPWNITNYITADGVIGQLDFQTRPSGAPVFGRMIADNQGLLWVVKGHSWVETQVLAYQLPLTTGAEPIIRIDSPIPLQGGGIFTWTNSLVLSGLAFQPGCDCLWLSDSDNNRVFRIKNVHTPYRTVDIVLGQKSVSGVHCNHGRDSDDGYAHPTHPSQDSLCHPGALAFDQNGNLFVADHNLEVAGNWRLLAFAANALPKDPPSVIYGIPATWVFGRDGNFTEPSCLSGDPMCGPWEPAFDSWGRMIIGFNGYLGTPFPQVYESPIANPLPIAALNDFYSQPFSMRFDRFGNIYVLDHNRNRILVYKERVVSTYTMTGTIKTDNRVPISGVNVIAKGYASADVSDDLGVFTLTRLITDSYEIIPTKTGCSFVPPSLVVSIPETRSSLHFIATCSKVYLPLVQVTKNTTPPAFFSATFLGQDGESYAGQGCTTGTVPDNVHIHLDGLKTDAQPVSYRVDDYAAGGVWATPCNPVSNWLLYVIVPHSNQADLYFKPFRDAPDGTIYTVVVQYNDGTSQTTTVVGTRIKP